MQFGVVGLGIALPLRRVAAESATPSVAPAADRAADDSATADSLRATTARDLVLAALVAPIAVGTRLSRTGVAAIRVDERNVGVVTLTDEDGHRWDAELARRTNDDAALNPIAVTKEFSLYLRNGGTGRTPTNERIGLAVVAIADAVRRNEDAVPVLTLASRAEVWASTGYRVIR
jgi:hypothetical protein